MYLSMPASIAWLKRIEMEVLVGTATEFPPGTTAASTVLVAVDVGEAPVIIWLLDCELPPHATTPKSAATAIEPGTNRFISASRRRLIDASRLRETDMQKDASRLSARA
jgi:hypothetical protein